MPALRCPPSNLLKAAATQSRSKQSTRNRTAASSSAVRSYTNQNCALRRKAIRCRMPPMEDFSRDCLRIGCLRAFVHFSLTLRGREELVVTVRTQVHFCGLDRL